MVHYNETELELNLMNNIKQPQHKIKKQEKKKKNLNKKQ